MKVRPKTLLSLRPRLLGTSTVKTISANPIYRSDPLDEKALIVPLQNDRQPINLCATTKNYRETKHNEAGIDHNVAAELETIEQKQFHVKSVPLAVVKEKLIRIRLLWSHAQLNIVRKIESKRIKAPMMQRRIDDPIEGRLDAEEPKAKLKNRQGKQPILSAQSIRMSAPRKQIPLGEVGATVCGTIATSIVIVLLPEVGPMLEVKKIVLRK